MLIILFNWIDYIKTTIYLYKLNNIIYFFFINIIIIEYNIYFNTKY